MSEKLLFPAIPILFVSIILNPPSSYAGAKNTTSHYVGSFTCKNCHKKEYTSFMTYAKKSRSFESIERMKKGLTEDELKKCYFCHTTGYGKAGGFVSPEKTPHLKNAGCEVCHGPGEVHVKTRNPENIMRHLTVEDCNACHTVKRVRAFRYRPMIHGGAH